MVRTPRFNLPFAQESGQKQRETINDLMRSWDALVHPLILDKDLTAPPGSPTTGDAYIVGASATGGWAGQDNDIAVWYYTKWHFTTPWNGLTVWVDDENTEYRWETSAWAEFTPTVGGTVGISGTPVNNQIAVWTNSTTVEGDANLTYDSATTTFNVGGNITLTGTVDGIDIAARDHDAVTLAGTGTYLSLGGQVITVDPITESDISDLQAYILDITAEPLGDLQDVVITTVVDNEVLAYDSTSGNWINQTASEAGLAAASHTHDASEVTTGTFADARISQSSVTQHEGAIDHDALTNFVANEHIDWTAATAAFSTTGTAATGALTVTGNIVVTGTVDGRDIATDGGTLDTHVALTNEHIDWTAATANLSTSGTGVIDGWKLGTSTTYAGIEDLSPTADWGTAANYAFLAQPGGRRYINAPTGQDIHLRINNSTIIDIDATNVDISNDVLIGGRHGVLGG